MSYFKKLSKTSLAELALNGKNAPKHWGAMLWSLLTSLLKMLITYWHALYFMLLCKAKWDYFCVNTVAQSSNYVAFLDYALKSLCKNTS